MYRFAHRCVDAVMHQLTLTAGLGCLGRRAPLRFWGRCVRYLGTHNRKRRQVLRRGPRIVPLRTHPDAFLNCSPLRRSGSFCSGSCEPSPPLKFPKILSWLAPALEILPVRNYSEEPLRSSCLPKSAANRSGSEEPFHSAPASWGLCAPLGFRKTFAVRKHSQMAPGSASEKWGSIEFFWG